MKILGFSNINEIIHFSAVGVLCLSNGIAAGVCGSVPVLQIVLTVHSIFGVFVFGVMSIAVGRRTFCPGDPDNLLDTRCYQTIRILLILYAAFTFIFGFFLFLGVKTGYGLTPCWNYTLAMLIISTIFILVDFFYLLYRSIRHGCFPANDPNQATGQQVNWANQGVSVILSQKGMPDQLPYPPQSRNTELPMSDIPKAPNATINYQK
ncbi:uncharacterized protein LOC134239070 [Saccostrea cucullata]|uniref:uncharacterized protein LOC134239070 n=1 Tax=Saccostrea cuccullata TaxID=36930 RepID=UPI002ED45A07